MEFIEASQVSPDILEKIEFDLIIVSSGYEERSVFLPENYNFKVIHKVALAYTDKRKGLYRKRNDRLLNEKGFKLINASSQDPENLYSAIQRIIKAYKNMDINILIDYSCMTKIIYAGIINLFINDESILRKAQIYFSYTPAKFCKPLKIKQIRKIESIVSLHKKKNESKPTALVIGMGIEKSKAKIIYHKIRPDRLVLMYADPSFDKKYVELIFENNQDIISLTEPRNLINYPLYDIDRTFEILTNLCLDLRMKFNVILAPLGPKVFALNCLLHSVKFPDIDVWRISAGKNEPCYQKSPEGSPLVLKTIFELEEEE